MIIEGKSFITNSLYPNIDWTGEADFVIPDGSPLAIKISKLSPNFNLVIENNKLIDVTPINIGEDGYIDLSKYR